MTLPLTPPADFSAWHKGEADMSERIHSDGCPSGDFGPCDCHHTMTKETAMGNHDVGRGMSAAARGFWAGNGDAPVTKEKALAVLDAAAESYRGADAEFDDEADPNTPLGRLMEAAFGPWKGDDWDSWYETVYRPFRNRYEFC